MTVLEKGRDPKPPIVQVLQPSSKECQNQKDHRKKKTLVCVARGFYPDHVGVVWSIDGGNVTDGVATDATAQRDGNDYRITSRLRVSRDSWRTPGRNFRCVVSFYNGAETVYRADWAVGGPEQNTTGGHGEAVSREKYLRVTQAAKLSYTVFIVKGSLYGAVAAVLVWKLQGSSGKQID